MAAPLLFFVGISQATAKIRHEISQKNLSNFLYFLTVLRHFLLLSQPIFAGFEI